MSFTQADVDALKSAIASGAKRVRYSDGTEVEYRDLEQLRSALAQVLSELSPPAAPRRAVRVFHRNGY